MRPTVHFLRGRQHGLSLIELLISMVIGLLLMISIVSTYLSASTAGRTADAQSRMNDDAQAALGVLAQQLRMAGDNPKQPNYTNAVPRNPVFGPGSFAIRGCDGQFSDVTTAANIGALTCAGGGPPHAVAVSYEANSFNTVPTVPPASSPTDCLGQSLPQITNAAMPVWNGLIVVPTAVNYSVADNRFYVGTTTVGGIITPSLFCKGNGGAEQAMVENVEDLQLRYGVAAIATLPPLTVAGYLTATEVSALGLASADLRWGKVATVRVCVVVRSENAIMADADSARYIPCFPTAAQETSGIAAPDLRMRRAYSTTVVLRNRTLP